MSVRTYATRLARAEKLAAAQLPAVPTCRDLVVVSFDEHGVGRLNSVTGPYQGCVCRRWPEVAYEPFEGDQAALEAYYARHGWQPQRTILLKPHLESGRRRRAHAT